MEWEEGRRMSESVERDLLKVLLRHEELAKDLETAVCKEAQGIWSVSW